MFVKVFLGSFAWRSLGQCPSGHVLLAGGERGVLGRVTARTDRSWRARLVLQSAIASSVAKRVLGCLPQLGLALRVVLRAWILLQVVWLHLNRQG